MQVQVSVVQQAVRANFLRVWLSTVSIQFVTFVTDLIKKHDVDIIMVKLLYVQFLLVLIWFQWTFTQSIENSMMNSSFFSSHPKNRKKTLLFAKDPNTWNLFFQVEFCQWYYFYSNVNGIFIIFPSSHTPNIGFYFYHPTIPHSIQKKRNKKFLSQQFPSMVYVNAKKVHQKGWCDPRWPLPSSKYT